MRALRFERPIALPSFPLRLELVPALLLAATSAVLLVCLTGPLCPDVAGQFALAHAMRGGSRLYTDIIEINPPLWFWLAMPMDWLADTIGVRNESVTIVVVATAVAGALRALDLMLVKYDRRLRVAFVTYAGAVLLIMPIMQLEQREHIALIGAVPYLVLAAMRRQGHSVAWPLATLVGLGAALGFALKHYFLGVPVLIEIWLIVALRWQWRPLRPETIAMAAAAVAYVAAFMILTPQYLTNIVPLLLSAYQGVGPGWLHMLGLVQIVWLCLIVALASQHRLIRRGSTPLTMAFLIGALGFAAAWAIQSKGYMYHSVPTTGCLAMAFAALLWEAKPPGSAKLVLVAPALLIAPLSFAVVNTEIPLPPAYDIGPALADLRRGDSYVLISSFGTSSWAATVDRGLRYSSRYYQFWMLDALVAKPKNPATVAFVDRAIRETAFDFRCQPPKTIVFLRFIRSGPRNVVADPYDLFMSVPQFAAVLGHYRLSRTGPVYDAYRQQSALDPVDVAKCRHGG